MPGREEWDVYGSEQQNKRRSYVWPAVALFMAGLAAFSDRNTSSQNGAGGGTAQSSADSTHSGGSNAYSSDGRYTKTFRFSYWIFDGHKSVKKEHFIHREMGGNADPWARIFQDGFYSKEEVERLERMRRMAEAFHRERAHYGRSYQKWQEPRDETSDPQQGARDDWSWTKSDWETFKKANHGYNQSSRSPYAQYYKTLGLDESKASTYSQADIKAAYRAKAMEYHPDRNQHRKDYAEGKFREVLAAYEVLKR